MKRRLVAAVAGLLVVATACGGSSRSAPPESRVTQIAPREGVTSLVLEGHVELEVTGAVESRISADTPINVLTSVGLGAPEQFWQLTVGVLPQHILEPGGGLKIRPAFDLVGYEGDGRYTILPSGAAQPTDEELDEGGDGPDRATERQAGGVRSGIVFVVSTDDDDVVTNYSVLTEPCSLDVAEQGTRGSIRCRGVTNGTDEVSFTWSWTADPDALVEDLTAGTPGGADPTAGGSGPEGAPSDAPAELDGRDAEQPSGTGPSDDEPATGKNYGISAPWKLDVEISPDDCATPGSPASVAVDTVPEASITLVVGYSDAQPHGSTILGQTGPTGEFNWAFAVAPDAPRGQADLLVNVTPNESNHEHDGSGGGLVRAFEVRTSC